MIFRAKKNTSTVEYDLLIQKILQGEGYSREMSRYIAAVSRHETGNYSSAVFRRSKNMFGMKFPRLRQTLAVDEDASGYAVYSSAANSVRDMVLYLESHAYPHSFPSARDLVVEMKRKKYFEADLSEYIEGVERALNNVVPL